MRPVSNIDGTPAPLSRESYSMRMWSAEAAWIYDEQARTVERSTFVLPSITPLSQSKAVLVSITSNWRSSAAGARRRPSSQSRNLRYASSTGIVD